jgi:hypothetical protein
MASKQSSIRGKQQEIQDSFTEGNEGNKEDMARLALCYLSASGGFRGLNGCLLFNPVFSVLVEWQRRRARETGRQMCLLKAGNV